MIGVSTQNSELRIQARLKIANADHGQWDPVRLGRLIELIKNFTEAAELVDGSMQVIKEMENKQHGQRNRRKG